MSAGELGEDTSRDQRVGQLVNEYCTRLAFGNAESESSFLARHPEYAIELRGHFDLLRRIGGHLPRTAYSLPPDMFEPCDEPGFVARLGSYKIVRERGRGGMGIVFEAVEEPLGRKVALKIIRPELHNDTAALARFRREAKAIAALNSPYIVTVYQVGVLRELHFMAMEYVEGPSLAQLIAQTGPIETVTCRLMFGQLLLGLQAAHGAGFVHRDIKPTNLLISNWACDVPVAGVREQCADSRPVIKIADFGLVRLVRAETLQATSTGRLGTPGYMSPEQIQGDRPVDERTDIYSAGIVLYEMLTGMHPHEPGSSIEVPHGCGKSRSEITETERHETDQVLGRLAQRLMCEQPADRPQTVGEVLLALESGQPLAKPRAVTNRVLRKIIALIGVLFCVGAWFAAGHFRALRGTPSGELHDRITMLRVDDKSPTHLLAAFGNDPTERVLFSFDESVGSLTAYKCVDSSAGQTIFVGARKAWDGYFLFAIDWPGRTLRRLTVSTKKLWPDIPEVTEFIASSMAAGNLDGVAGDEIVVGGRAMHLYPGFVALLDGQTGAERATYWNLGNVDQVLIVPKAQGKGRSAIVCRGYNNKLDGFVLPRKGDASPATRLDVVTCLWILDPAAMPGVGPPWSDRLPDLPRAHPRSYAYLDAPGASISSIDVEPCPGATDSQQCIQAFITQAHGMGGPILTLDMDLKPQKVILSTTGASDLDEDYWRARWKYVGDPATPAETGSEADCSGTSAATE